MIYYYYNDDNYYSMNKKQINETKNKKKFNYVDDRV
jgi:hypothetical protein